MSDLMWFGWLCFSMAIAVILLFVWLESRWSSPLDEDTDDDIAPLLGVVSPKKKKDEDA